MKVFGQRSVGRRVEPSPEVYPTTSPQSSQQAAASDSMAAAPPPPPPEMAPVPMPGTSSGAPEIPTPAPAPSMQALMGGATMPDRQSPIVDRGGPGINPNTGRRVPPMSMRVLIGRLY